MPLLLITVAARQCSQCTVVSIGIGSPPGTNERRTDLLTQWLDYRIGAQRAPPRGRIEFDCCWAALDDGASMSCCSQQNAAPSMTPPPQIQPGRQGALLLRQGAPSIPPVARRAL